MRKIDPFHYGTIEKDEVNQQAIQNYFQLIDQAESFYHKQIHAVVTQMSENRDKTDIICLSGPSASGKTQQPIHLQEASRAMEERQELSRWTIFI